MMSRWDAAGAPIKIAVFVFLLGTLVVLATLHTERKTAVLCFAHSYDGWLHEDATGRHYLRSTPQAEAQCGRHYVLDIE